MSAATASCNPTVVMDAYRAHFCPEFPADIDALKDFVIASWHATPLAPERMTLPQLIEVPSGYVVPEKIRYDELCAAVLIGARGYVDALDGGDGEHRASTRATFCSVTAVWDCHGEAMRTSGLTLTEAIAEYSAANL